MPSERIQRQIDRLLDEAERATEERAWSVVRERALEVLTLDPENADAQPLLSLAERGLAALGSPDVPLSPLPEASTAQPTGLASFANGRYQVKRFLGEGGKKRVYLAHDSTLDRDVAFALIKTEGLDQTARERIAREAQAMGRLGAHPHIVTVFDLGEEAGGQPYMVTELMGGGDVEGLIERAPEHRVPLERVLAIATEVCRGLEFAHAKGIVHRDLKPGNVWLTESLPPSALTGQLPSPHRGGAGGEVTAKIGDFGLAVAIDRTRLTQAGMMVGTVSYMPPEQALGGEVTPRSDLYSLGAMLYELVTGRPPFLGQDSVAIIGQHLNTPPVAPSWHNPDCSRPLEALILRLLAKDPGERPASAADVLAALQAIDLAPETRAGEAQVDAELLDSLAGGVFVGRQRELGELKAALEDGLSGRGRLVAFVGEPGIGKTRTAQELATYACLRQCQVLWGRCYEGAGAPPYWPWVQLIRAYVRKRPAERLRSEMGAGAADIAEVVSDLRERLPGLAPPPQLEPEQARFRLFDSITTFLRAASQAQPLVLVLEDLHWADRPTLLLLEFLAHELAGSRLLVLMTYRDVEVSRQHPLALTLGELTRERLFQRVLLRGLGRDDVARFVALTTGAEPPAGLAEAVFAQTEGNPLFVTEVVRLLVQEGHIAGAPHQASLPSPPSPHEGRHGPPQEEEGPGMRGVSSWTVRIPEGVLEVIGRRLNRLSERCNQVLTVAAVIGRQFSIDQLAALAADISRERLVEVIEEALAARLVEELAQAAGRYQFTHALIQETLVTELSLTRRVTMHGQIAEALERLYGDQAETHAAELAYHFNEAVSLLGPQKLVQYSLLAGERALAGYAYEEALAHFQRGLEAKGREPGDLETAALLWGLGRSRMALLQLDEAFTSLAHAFELYRAAGDTQRAVSVAQISVPPLFGELSGVRRLLEGALELVPEGSPDAGRLHVAYAMALYYEDADDAAAQPLLESALGIARREGDRALELQALGSDAYIDIFEMRNEAAAEKSISVFESAAALGNLPGQAVGAAGASTALQMGILDCARSQEFADAAMTVAERLRDRYFLARAYFVSMYVSMLVGDWDRMRNLGITGLGYVPTEGRLLAFTGIALLQTGELEQARGYAERLIAALRSSGARGPAIYGAPLSILLGVESHITGSSEHHALAREVAEAMLAAPLPTLYRHLARFGLAIQAVDTGDAVAAAEQYSQLLKFPNTTNPMLRQRVLGLLAKTVGRTKDAAAHFEDALSTCRGQGLRPEYAWSCLEYGELLLERNGIGDQARATALLAEGLQIAKELGMRPLMERILSHRRILKA